MAALEPYGDFIRELFDTGKTRRDQYRSKAIWCSEVLRYAGGEVLQDRGSGGRFWSCGWCRGLGWSRGLGGSRGLDGSWRRAWYGGWNLAFCYRIMFFDILKHSLIFRIISDIILCK